MEEIKINLNCIEYFETEQEKEKKIDEQDKDFIIADLMMQNAELQQQINDISFIIAEIQLKEVKQ